MNATTALPLALAVPLVGAILVALTGRVPNLREAVTLITGASLLAIIATLVPDRTSPCRVRLTWSNTACRLTRPVSSSCRARSSRARRAATSASTIRAVITTVRGSVVMMRPSLSTQRTPPSRVTMRYR